MKTTPYRITWTGGSRPAHSSAITRTESQLRRELFREQVETFSGYWGDAPNRDTLRIFFNRARYDAHATHRSQAE